jgi:hypothetical protein
MAACRTKVTIMKAFIRHIVWASLALGAAGLALETIDARQIVRSDFTTANGQTLSLRVRPVVVHPDGRAAVNVSGAVSLSTTEFRSVLLPAEPGDSCQIGAEVRHSDRDRFAPARPFVWTIAARLVAWSGQEATLDVRIERHDTIGAFGGAAAVQTPRRLILREGEHRIVDMARITGRDCEAVQIDVELVINEPDPVRDAALSYDIWLMHHDPNGSTRTVPFRTSGLQGREVPYAFKPLEHTADGSAVRNGRGEVHTTIAGVLRGRARLDGRLDLTVAASRTVRAGQLGIGDGGTKHLTVDDGETVELELPPDISGSLPGVDLPRFLAGQSTAVRVTARRVR